MGKPRILIMLTLVFCLGVGASVAGADQELPPAETILDRFIAVTGGEEVHRSLHSRSVKGKMIFEGMGLEAEMVSYEAAPVKRYMRIDSDALGTIESGTDGETVWYMSDNTGVIIEQGVARAVFLRDMAFPGSLDWRPHFPARETVGIQEINQKPCHKVVLKPLVGEPETRFYEIASGLLVKVERTRLSTVMPPSKVEVLISDYRWVDGVFVAHQRTQISQGCAGEQKITFLDSLVEHNVDLPAARFALPEAVRTAASKADSDVKVAERRPGCGARKESGKEAAKAKSSGCSKD